MCFVVVFGWVFLCCLIDFMKGVCKFYYYICFLKGVKLDIVFWFRFLIDFNGKLFFFDDVWEILDMFKFYIDLVGFIGFGVVFGNCWLYGFWLVFWKIYNIVVLEFFLIVIVIYIWGLLMVDKCVLFFSDNVIVVDIINK